MTLDELRVKFPKYSNVPDDLLYEAVNKTHPGLITTPPQSYESIESDEGFQIPFPTPSPTPPPKPNRVEQFMAPIKNIPGAVTKAVKENVDVLTEGFGTPQQMTPMEAIQSGTYKLLAATMLPVPAMALGVSNALLADPSGEAFDASGAPQAISSGLKKVGLERSPETISRAYRGAVGMGGMMLGLHRLGALSSIAGRTPDMKALERATEVSRSLNTPPQLPIFSKLKLSIPDPLLNNRGSIDLPWAPKPKKTPIWYSQLSKTITDKKLSGPGPNIAAQLEGMAKKGEFKAEELEWTGIVDELRKDPKKKWTNQELADFVAANNVQIKEVTKGAPLQTMSLEEAMDALDRGESVVRFDSIEGDVVSGPLKHKDLMRYAENEVIHPEFILESEMDYNIPKFSDWVEPGGENYRELLLTLPPKRTQQYFIAYKNGPTLGSGFSSEKAAWTEIEQAFPGKKNNFEVRLGEGDRALTEKNPDNYRSSHYDEPNILAHVRFNERTDADGKRVLFLEEIQSDWHQAGRKKGYKTAEKEDPDLVEFIRQEMKGEEDDALLDKLIDRYSLNGPDYGNEAKEILHRQSTGIPNAPFKKTGAWTMLAFKRMVRYAAENGFDRIAWTTGEQQSARYELSKHMDALRVSKDKEGYHVKGTKDGRTVLSEGGILEEDLSDAVGEGLAAKIIDDLSREHKTEIKIRQESDGPAYDIYVDDEHHVTRYDLEDAKQEAADRSLPWDINTYSGLDLKIPSKGMIGYYNDIVPAEVNSFFNKGKWGNAKVGQTKIETKKPRTQYEVYTPEGKLDLLEMSRKAAESYISRRPEYKRDQWKIKEVSIPSQNTSVHFLDITPEMRSKALSEGMPMFKRESTPSTPKPLKSKGKDVIGRDIPDWRGATVYHSTDEAGFKDISSKGFRILGDEAEDGQGGYYGEAVSFTPDKEYSAQFGKHLTSATLPDDIKILNLNDPKDWEIFQSITKNKDISQYRSSITKAGYDGVYDAGAGDLFLFNPEKAKLNEPSMKHESTPSTSTPEFKKWFGNSKVVDENGKPLVVYHGGRFNEYEHGAFDTEYGSHFGTKRAAEERLGGAEVDHAAEEANVYKERGRFYLDEDEWPNAPLSGFPTDKAAREWVAREVADDWNENNEVTVTAVYLSINNPKRIRDQGYEESNWVKAIDKAKAEGYDGLVYRNETEDKGKDSWVAFSPTQIKSINNRGSFDPSDSNINYQKLPELKPHGEGVTRENPLTLIREFKNLKSQYANLPGTLEFIPQSEWPKELRDQIPSGSRVLGVAWKDSVYLDPTWINTSADLKTVFTHEVLGHWGLEKVLGPERFNTLLTQLSKGIKDSSLQQYTDFYDLSNPAQRLEAVREFIADSANLDKPGFISRARFYINKLLRDMGLKIELSENDVRNILHREFGKVKEYMSGKKEIEPGVIADKSGSIDSINPDVIPAFSRQSLKKTQDNLTKYAIKMGKNPAELQKYFKDLNSVARTVVANKNLDYAPNPLYSSLKVNSDPQYKASLDFSTNCKKRLVLKSTIEEVQRSLGRMLKQDEYMETRQALKDAGEEVSCGICYVDTRRMQIGPTIDAIAENHPELPRELFLSQEGFDTLARDYPEVYAEITEAFGRNHKAKMMESRTDYRGEILSRYTGKTGRRMVDEFNKRSGLRLQSWSDLELPHVLDIMQAVGDMNAVNLMAHTYTKVLDFPRIFGNTGIMINVSLIPKGKGLTRKGTLLVDDIEGAPFAETLKIRDEFEDTVGTVMVGVSDDHITACLDSPQIDYVIPFHSSGMSGEMRERYVGVGWHDYQQKAYKGKYQRETDKKTGASLEILWNEYGPDARTPEELIARYKEVCEKHNAIPKFSQWIDHPNYYKLLVDRKFLDHKGNYIEQRIVAPEFNLPRIQKILKAYGGVKEKANTKVVREMVRRFK